MALIFRTFVIDEHVQAEKKKPGAVCLDWNRKSERHEGISTCEVMQEKFPDDVASTLGDFIAYLANNGVVEPHIECHKFKTDFTKDDKDQVTGCTLSIDNVEPCAVRVRMQAANANPEFDNLGSSLVLGMMLHRGTSPHANTPRATWPSKTAWSTMRVPTLADWPH